VSHPSDFSKHFMIQEQRRTREATERLAAAIEAATKNNGPSGGPTSPTSSSAAARGEAVTSPASGNPEAVRIADLPDTLTVKQAALVLGLKPQTIYDWVESKRLPCLRAGRAIRFDKSALLAFRQAQVVAPEPPDRVSINLRRPRRAS
jgi:excisionase family DNA binding protein